jgi:hypothetical protein
MRLIIIVFLSILPLAGSAQTLDTFLNTLQPPLQETYCKDQVKNSDEYIKCLEQEIDKNPSIDTINFLAGVYALNKEYDKAIKLYETNIANGDKKAIYYVAGIYNEVLKEHEKAKRYFEMIKDYEDSTCQLGGIVAIVKDSTPFAFINNYLAKRKTLKFYDNEIKQGNLKAYGCKGLYYNKHQEYEKAEKVFKEGVKNGDTQSLFYLGNLYGNFIYDIPQSLRYYKQSFEKGNMQAAHNLGVFYERDRQWDEAIKWYKHSAKAGDMKSLYNIANIYRFKDEGENALKVYKKVGEMGFDEGHRAVWIYYTDAKEYDKAKEYLVNCMAQGNPVCARYLGRIYDDDFKEYDKAKQWYIKGYEMGDSESAFNLGFLYDKTLNDNEKAIQWYERASEMGNVKGTFNIAIIYKLEKNDTDKAIKWFKKAYTMGDEGAKKQLQELGAL